MLDKEEKNPLISVEERKKVAALLYVDGEKYFMKGKLDLSLILFKESFVFDSTRADTTFQLGKAYFKTASYGMAAKFFGRTIGLLTPAAACNFIDENEGLYFSKLSKSELTGIGFELYLVGKRLYAKKQFDNALKILRKALHYKSDQISVHRLLVQIYTQKGNKAKIAYHLRQIEKLRK